MANKQQPKVIKYIPSARIGGQLESMIKMSESARKQFERRWYNNNFFDDGYHFRYISRSTGRIMDLNEKKRLTYPTRAIPKASLQVRGMANLLLQPEYRAVIYPEEVSTINYPNPEEYQRALQTAKNTAQTIGHWVMEEWKNQDIFEKLMQMMILTAKHGVSYMQIFPDAVKEDIKTQVYDAFDIYLMGNYTSIYDSPFICKAVPMLLGEIMANEEFDEQARMSIAEDNKYAQSAVKESYMRSRFGGGNISEYGQTKILKEAFFKEYLDNNNMKEVARDLGDSFKEYEEGDIVIRQVFAVDGTTLKDTYLDMKEYPFVDLRLEPGPIYNTPLIERFIPANKTLDMIVSRIERYLNTMMVGTWLKREGEHFGISNIPGGQLIEYKSVPPTQGAQANLPPYIFNMIELLEKFIEEQGTSTSALSQIPSGVKSGVAIESLKASEYANLKIASSMLKQTVKNISKRFIDIGDKYFVKPRTMILLEKGEPKYYQLVGQQGVEARKNAKDEPYGEDVTVITNDYNVDIEVETGLGFTTDGKRATMQQIATFVQELAAQGLMSQEAVKEIVSKFMETFEFGNTQEFMNKMDQGTQASPLNEEQIMQMKVAILEVLKDAGVVGKEKEQQLVDASKVGTLETLQDLQGGGGQSAPAGQPAQPIQPTPPVEGQI